MNLGLYLSSASCHFTEAMHYAHLHDWFVKLEKLISRQNLSQHIDFKTNPSSKLSIKQQVDICETALSGQSVAQLKTDSVVFLLSLRSVSHCGGNSDGKPVTDSFSLQGLERVFQI